MGKVVPCFGCIMILFLIKNLFYCISDSLIFLAEKVIEAVKVGNNGSGILFLLRKMFQY